MRNKKCNKCKKMSMIETYGGLSFGEWYQTFECSICNHKKEFIISDWNKKTLLKTEFFAINTRDLLSSVNIADEKEYTAIPDDLFLTKRWDESTVDFLKYVQEKCVALFSNIVESKNTKEDDK